MTTEASIGHGSVLALESTTTPGTWIDISETKDLSPPSESTDVLDATHMASPDGVREYIEGLTDPGEASFEMNFLPGSAAETEILRQRRRTVRITYPNGATWTFVGIRTGYEPAVPNDDIMTASVSYKVTSTVTRAAGA